jgi:hypothetical protein
MHHLEDQAQISLMEWSAHCRVPNTNYKVDDLMIHIPNGGKRNAREAARLKQMGVKAGVSDLLLPWPCGGFGGLWIEMKAPELPGRTKPKVQPSQKEWLNKMEDANYQTAICFGWLQARKAIELYLQAKT